MREVLPVEVILKTLQECNRSIERMIRVVGVVSPLDMDQIDALKDLRLRCTDSIHTINLWHRKGLPELTVEDDPRVGKFGETCSLNGTEEKT